MKLFFKKDESGNITVQLEKGTFIIDYDYVEMLKQLIEENEIECDWSSIEDIEKQKFEELLSKIKNAVNEGMNKPLE
ncbi:hypothetical protein [Prevotella pallens]|uniref:hypothetical protein n=1 Tax=Prevotella pallens TaxID=60133 RepID=UPI001CB6285E|nr:hypothetical protein [Prevotella pallens]MBF1459621.1 hypothetical protein [Prevotella pallens]MBF1490969.1 hypothetical protein [Prevotella pallens]